MYFHLAVHKVSKINVHISKSSIHLPWLQLESPGFARFLGSVTGPRLLLAALCPPHPTHTQILADLLSGKGQILPSTSTCPLDF